MNIEKMLLQEGIKPDEMMHEKYPTFTTKHGFFTIKPMKNMVSLVHFCIDKEHRTPDNARELVRFLIKIIKLVGYKKLVIHSKKQYLDKLIQYYFRVKPYANENGYNFYEVKIT